MAKVLEHEKAAVVELFAVGALNRLQVASKDRPTVGAIAWRRDLDLGGEGGVGGESARVAALSCYHAATTASERPRTRTRRRGSFQPEGVRGFLAGCCRVGRS